jgi:glutamate decarboxylase
MTSGATISNISGLWIARNLAFAPSAGFAGIEEEGIAPALAYSHVRKAVIICSRFAHYSIQKAAAMLGLGEGSVIMAPVDCNGRMDITALRRIVDDCGIRGFRVVAIVATAGTTDCGSIDPLEEIGEIAADARIHFHVDAAWGAPLIFSQRYCARLTGIDRADSITIDAHKQFYLPIGSSVLLLRDPRAASVIEKQTSYMLQEGSGDLGKRSLEGSRPGSALLLHAALNIIGPRGYGWLIEDNIQKAKVMCRKLLALRDFELLIPPETNIVLYRYVPHDMKIAARNRTLAASDNQFLNKLNEKIQRTQNESGRAFVSRTTIENVYEGCPVTALRAVLGNPFTTEADIDFILEDQIRIAGQVLQESRDGN